MEVLAISAAVVVALLTAVLLVFAVFSVYLVIVHRRYAHIPQPKGASFYFGHVLIINNKKKCGTYLPDILNEWAMEYGLVYVIWGVHRPLVIAVDEDSIKVQIEILSRKLKKSRYLTKCLADYLHKVHSLLFPTTIPYTFDNDTVLTLALSARQIPKPPQEELLYLFGERLLKDSLLTIQHYDDWKDRRRTMDQAFVRSYLHGLVPVYNNVVKRDLIEALREKANGTTKVPMKTEFSRVSHQVISEVAFGIDFERDPYVQSLAGKEGLTPLMKDIIDGIELAEFALFLQYVPFFGRKYASNLHKIREIGRYCINLRMKALKNKEEVPLDILSQILSIVQKEKNIDMEVLIDEFILFYLAGHETTRTLLSFTTGLLIQHPDILQRVREEIDEVVGNKTSVEADDLDKLTYMNQVLEESLRLFPPATVMKMTPPEGLKLGGYNVPGETTVLPFAYSTQRFPEYFDDPLKFDPNRFDPGQKRPSPYVYYPFGIGHRSCIGRVFAMMEAKVVMVHLLRAYNLSLPNGYILKCAGNTAVMHPIDLLPCKLTPR